ncbi:MAG: hypothetical protein D6706_03320 [Chloroflexi bacterium]|nr:MAG: hypothetical protein D6706_03320 [Chloroflexota bacterium]
MTNKTRENLEKRVRRALFTESFFRLESATVIALTLILTAFAPQLIEFIPWWAWLLLGSAGEVALIYSSMTDPEFARQVVANLLQNEFKPERLRDKELQIQMKRALDYRSRIEQAIRAQNTSMLRDELVATASQIDEWLENIYGLAQRIDRYRREKPVFERDRQRIITRQKELEKQLKTEDDPRVRSQIEETLASLNRNLETMEKLENTIQRAELQLENTLANLATIYSQTLLVDAKDIDSGRARRLRQEITEEVHELNDVLSAMDEVYTAENAA